MTSNKPLHLTRRGGVAHPPRRGPVVEARLAGERRCSTGYAWVAIHGSTGEQLLSQPDHGAE